MVNFNKEHLNIGIVPFGSMGKGIAAVAERRGHKIGVYQRLSEIGGSDKFRGLENIKIFPSMRPAVEDADVLFMVSPSTSYEELAREALSYARPDCIVVNTTKGLIPDGRRMTQVLEGLDPTTSYRVAAMSGPNLSSDMERGAVMGTLMASHAPEVPRYLRDILQSPRFLVEPEDDVIGLELGGAFKNIIALLAGMLDKVGVAPSTKATCITNLNLECVEIAKRQGAEESTFTGLSWVGDILLCTVDNQSRNHRAGERLVIDPGSAEDFLAGKLWVAEGVNSIRGALTIARACDLNEEDVPNLHLINGIVHERENPVKAINALIGKQSRGFGRPRSARFQVNRVARRAQYIGYLAMRTFNKALSTG